MWPFKKKIQNIEINCEPEPKENPISTTEISIQEVPKICCIDIDPKITTELQKIGCNIYTGTLGKKIRIPNKNQYDNRQVLLNFDFPENIHEYDVFIIDLNNSECIEYNTEDHVKQDHTGKYSYSLLSSYPETIFDPRPYSSKILNNLLKQIGKRKHMIITFTTANYSVDYEPIKFYEDGYQRQNIETHGIYSFYDYVPLNKAKYGKEIIVTKGNLKQEIKNFLSMTIGKTVYHQTFHHPTLWDGNNNVEDPQYVPLLYNSSEEIISFCKANNESPIFFFPQMDNKLDFLKTFLLNIAPTIVPELFPFNTEFNWISDDDYWLPKHEELLDKKNEIIKDYEEKLDKAQKRIDTNYKKYSFLHDILTKTGDDLVNVLIQYLQWLGFEKCIDADSLKKDDLILEEDIQIELDNGELLIIESKGIGGTSTDSECSQISKIKHRRCKERKSFDVYALYIVNHQRYIPPLKRTNPPFNENQIQDAKNDERGLLSTWQLFNLYNDIENGIINKKEARQRFLDFGLVTFEPRNLIYIDEPTEIYKDGYVCIINIENIKLTKGEVIYIERENKFNKIKILEIKINNKPVSECDNGEIGLLLDTPIKKKTKLHKKLIVG